MRNCALGDLRETIGEMHAAWKRMTKRTFFPTKFWFRRTEVSFKCVDPASNTPASFHPHIHAVLLVPAGYFSHGYVKQTEWRKQWMDAARLDYAPVVDVRRATSRSTSGGATIDQSKAAALEASKYATKSQDLIAMGSSLGTYHWQVKGLRLSASSNSLKPYIADTPIDASQLVDNETVDALETVKGKALWFEDIQEYLFSDIL